LQTALEAVKEAMKAETGAAEAILAGVKKISLANDIKEVFPEVKKAYDGTVSADQVANFKQKLEGYRDSTKKSA
jgi:hypothetical protein